MRCDFSGVRADRRFQPLFSARPRSVFRDCRFDGADLRRIKPDQARFERCTFDDARLDRWLAANAEFVECRFAGPLTAVTFSARPFGPALKTLDPPRVRNEFRGNDFRDAELVGTLFVRGVDLGAQRLPENERYVRLDRMAQRLGRARADIVRWDDHEDRLEGLALLRALATNWREQGEIIALRVDPLVDTSSRLQARVWAVLERALP